MADLCFGVSVTNNTNLLITNLLNQRCKNKYFTYV